MNRFPLVVISLVVILCVVLLVQSPVVRGVAGMALVAGILYFLFSDPGREVSPLPAEDLSRRLDPRLVETIRENLKQEPSAQLREMLIEWSTGRWSREALEAASLILEERASDGDAEPVYRTVPRSEDEQAARENESVAPAFSRDLLTLDVGSRVYCPWREEAGTILRWHDEEERFYIRFDSGEGEWATLGMFA